MSGKSTASEIVRRRSGRDTRAEILAVAERYFADRGFEATRLEDVATKVGIKRAAIFYHFRDKQDLYMAVLADVFGDLGEALPSGGSATDRLEASMIGWIDFIAQRPNVVRLILREAANVQLRKATPFTHAGKATSDWFSGVIAEGIASGEFHPRIEPYRFMSLMGAITIFHFAAMPWLVLDQPVDPWGRAELDKHKREILLVARTMLGIESPTPPDKA